MTREQQIDDCWRLVSACGTADQLAMTAREIIEMGILLNDSDLKNFYEEKMLPKIAHYAGVPDYVDHEKKTVTPVELTDKQINFLARMLFQFYDVDVLALKDACIRGLMSGVRTKDIEDKIREVVKSTGE